MYSVFSHSSPKQRITPYSQQFTSGSNKVPLSSLKFTLFKLKTEICSIIRECGQALFLHNQIDEKKKLCYAFKLNTCSV